jgi:hypothetical protein
LRQAFCFSAYSLRQFTDGDLDLVSDMDIHTAAVIVRHTAMDFLMDIPAITLRIMAIMRRIMGMVVMDMGDMDITPIVITTDHIMAVTTAGITVVTTGIVTVGRFKNNTLTGATTATEAHQLIEAGTEVTPDPEGIQVTEAVIEATQVPEATPVPEVTQVLAFVDAS